MKAFNDPAIILEQTKLIDTFFECAKIDTQSDAESPSFPSTPKQLDLQKVLEKKLLALGCTDVVLDKRGLLTATFPGNVQGKKTVGLLAHVDTSPDYSGKGVVPMVHANYDGGDIHLPKGDVTISPKESLHLADCVGDTIITASGDTLLGADDKAGIAEILAALEILSKDDFIKRPTLRIGFSPDEEIGRGASYFDVKSFGADYAYTLDGSFAGEVNFETFSADKAVVIFTGVSVHPGFAKGKMVNALRFLGKFLDELPKDESPETTDDRQGFTHPTSVKGNAAVASVELILREFDNQALADRGQRLRDLAAKIQSTQKGLKVEVEITPQYRNMADTLKKHPQVVENLMNAVKDAGIEPAVIPIRGGTDGSGLTAMGLPTPNIFDGGLDFHGPREWASQRGMALAVCTVLNLVQRWAE